MESLVFFYYYYWLSLLGITTNNISLSVISFLRYNLQLYSYVVQWIHTFYSKLKLYFLLFQGWSWSAVTCWERELPLNPSPRSHTGSQTLWWDQTAACCRWMRIGRVFRPIYALDTINLINFTCQIWLCEEPLQPTLALSQHRVDFSTEGSSIV